MRYKQILLRTICTTQFCCFFTAKSVQKNKRLAVHFFMYICMHVCMFVTECTIATAKQSVCLNYIKQSRDRVADSDKNYITSGSPNVCGEDNKYATLIFIIKNSRIGYIKCIAFFGVADGLCKSSAPRTSYRHLQAYKYLLNRKAAALVV